MRVAVALAALAVFAAPQSALAVVHIPAGQHADEITVIADDVRVDGTVSGAVTVLGGSLVVGPQGRLDAQAVVVGGSTTILPGGQIRGDMFQLGNRWPLPEGPVAIAVIAALFALRALATWLVISFAQILGRHRRIEDVAGEARVYPLRTLLVGVLAGLALGSISVLLAITILGLVAAAALWGVLLAAAVVGISVFLRELGDSPQGARLLGVSVFLPVLGEIVASFAIIVALGGLIRTLARPPRGPRISSPESSPSP